MLVVAWEAMYGSIPRLLAEESLSAYTVAVLATPPSDQDTLDKRQRFVDEWRQLVIGKSKKILEVTVATLKSLLQRDFGDEIRD